MKFYNLGSGSSGNCYLLQFNYFEKATDILNYGKHLQKQISIMIECGFHYKEIVKRAVMNNATNVLKSVNSVLISHEHGDHSLGMNELEKLGKKIYGPQSLISRKCVNENNALKPYETAIIDEDILVYPFNLHHDVECLGYIIYCRKSDEKVLFITDTKYVESDQIIRYKFDYIIIECNYDNAQAHAIYNDAKNAIDNGANPNEYFAAIRDYKRVLDTHMSNATCKKTLVAINNSFVSLEKCKAIFLIHMSNRHSKNALYEKSDFEKLFKKKVFVCRASGGVM